MTAAPRRTDPLAAALAFAIREAVRLEAERLAAEQQALAVAPDRANVVTMKPKPEATVGSRNRDQPTGCGLPPLPGLDDSATVPHDRGRPHQRSGRKDQDWDPGRVEAEPRIRNVPPADADVPRDLRSRQISGEIPIRRNRDEQELVGLGHLKSITPLNDPIDFAGFEVGEELRVRQRRVLAERAALVEDTADECRHNEEPEDQPARTRHSDTSRSRAADLPPNDCHPQGSSDNVPNGTSVGAPEREGCPAETPSSCVAQAQIA